MTSIVLFSNDLRLHDNLALYNACKNGDIIPVFVLDNKRGIMSNVWLYFALTYLNKVLNNKIIFLKGEVEEQIIKLIKKTDIKDVYYNVNFEPKYLKNYSKMKKNLKSLGVNVHTYNSHLLFNPKELLKEDSNYYKVFTAFYNNAMKKEELIRGVIPKPKNIKIVDVTKYSLSLNDLGLLPKHDDYKQKVKLWDISEQGGLNKLKDFIKSGKINNYEKARDYMAQEGTSMLSPYLHFGQVSVVQVYHDITKAQVKNQDCKEKFIKELMFREFSYYLLYNFPKLNITNFNPKFDNFLWQNNSKWFKAWKEGNTGIPIIDAGMRQLNQTGYMHNRVRMIVGSFLVKNLLIDWRNGLKYFEDMLFDADLAANSFSWQWVAGSGVDAAPYFRIFNPVLQSEKFDKRGEYIKKYVPELSKLDSKNIHNPSLISDEDAKKISFKKGIDYPNPIVDLKKSRQKALEIYQIL